MYTWSSIPGQAALSKGGGSVCLDIAEIVLYVNSLIMSSRQHGNRLNSLPREEEETEIFVGGSISNMQTPLFSEARKGRAVEHSDPKLVAVGCADGLAETRRNRPIANAGLVDFGKENISVGLTFYQRGGVLGLFIPPSFSSICVLSSDGKSKRTGLPHVISLFRVERAACTMTF